MSRLIKESKKRNSCPGLLINKKTIVQSKHSQVTLWIILAILIVAAVMLFFIIRGKSPIEIFRPITYEPQQYIEKCTRDATEEAINIMLPQGGYIQPSNYILYKNNKVAYLCYNNNYYYPCINQEPVYIEHLESEIKNYIQPKIQDCFYSLKKEYKKRGYSISEGTLNLIVDLAPRQVRIEVGKRLEMKKGEETRNYEKFKIRVNSPLYDLGIVAQEITSQEAKFCYFEYLGFSLLYPWVSIEKDQVGSEETASDIYKIGDKRSGKELLIAIRSCAMPGGL